MGIPKFYGSWLRRTRNLTNERVAGDNLSGVNTTYIPGRVNTLAIDLPGIIHKAAQIVWSYGEHYNKARSNILGTSDPVQLEAEFHRLISNEIQNIVKYLRPRNMLILAIDGKAPMAKIQQQRMRRFRSEPSLHFDSNSISPGTKLMQNLDNYLQRWILSSMETVKNSGYYDYETKTKYPVATLPSRVIYSSHLTPGEGEHKIMDIYRSGIVEYEEGTYNVLYGKDADLILTSLLSPVKNIIIMRESLNDFVNIEIFKERLQDRGIDYKDFVIVMSYVGNDFLPHQPSLEDISESIDIIIDIFDEIRNKLDSEMVEGKKWGDIMEDLEVKGEDEVKIVTLMHTSEGTINWNNMRLFLQELSYREPRMIFSRKPTKYPSELIEIGKIRDDKGKVLRFEFYDFRDAWYANALGPRGDTEVLEKLLGTTELDISIEDIVDMCKDYLNMVEWVYQYYLTGKVDWNMYYPYYHSPLIDDLYGVLKNWKPTIRDTKETEYTILDQLVAILPKRSFVHIPIVLHSVASHESPIYYLFPETFILEVDGKEKKDFGIPIIPFAEMSPIMKTVERLINKDFLKPWNEIEQYDYPEDITTRRTKSYYPYDIEDKGGYSAPRGSIGYSTRTKKDISGEYSERGRGEYSVFRGRGRGEYSGSRGRGGDRGRGKGEYSSFRGRGEYSGSRDRGRDRGDRGRGRGDRGRGRGRGEYANVPKTYIKTKSNVVRLYYSNENECKNYNPNARIDKEEYGKVHSIINHQEAIELLTKDQGSTLTEKIKDTLGYVTRNFREMLYVRIRDHKMSMFRVVDKEWKSWLTKFSKQYTNDSRFMWSFVKTGDLKWEEDDYYVSFYQGELQWYLENIAKSLNNCDFVINHRDQMMVPKENGKPFPHFTSKIIEEFKHGKLLPIFSFSSCSKFKDHTFITPDDIYRIADVYFHSRGCKLYEEPAVVEWQDRVPVALFRGRPTGFGEEKNVRIKLWESLKDDKNFDIGITADMPYNRDYYYRGKILPKPTNKFDKKPNLPFELFTDYKYVIYADGNVGAYRLASLFTLGSVVIVYNKEYDMWCDNYLIDKVNCVIVKTTKELRDAVKWLKDNDEKAKEIAEKGLELYDTYLTGMDALFSWGVSRINDICKEDLEEIKKAKVEVVGKIEERNSEKVEKEERKKEKVSDKPKAERVKTVRRGKVITKSGVKEAVTRKKL
jgi:hypothetical protein